MFSIFAIPGQSKVGGLLWSCEGEVQRGVSARALGYKGRGCGSSLEVEKKYKSGTGNWPNFSWDEPTGGKKIREGSSLFLAIFLG